MLPLLDLLQPSLQTLRKLSVPHRDALLDRAHEHLPRPGLGHRRQHPPLDRQAHLGGVVAEGSVGVKLSKALDDDPAVACHVMHCVPVLELHFVLYVALLRHLAGDACFAEGVLGRARDLGVGALLHLFADRALDAERERTVFCPELDHLEALGLGEHLSLAGASVLDHNLVVAVRVPPPSALLVELLQENAAVSGDVALVPAEQLDLED
mmetsp:Transcript_18931/g.45627  ORF Transcript_18931/g.45627 Transcript_18931/m.45627 type:complete len:210 (-) Transcript_18931:572-1201(-)